MHAHHLPVKTEVHVILFHQADFIANVLAVGQAPLVHHVKIFSSDNIKIRIANEFIF